ncbi:PH domain-containing protein [Amycolatopsis ultiminotia]
MTEQETALVIRPRRALVMCSVLAVVLLAVFVVVAVLLRSSRTGVVFEPSDQVAMIGIGVLLAAGTMLFAMARVRADATGIEIRNVLTTRRFAWADVLSISFPDGASWARLELPDDEYFSVMAVQAVDRERAVAAVRALRRLHRAAAGS